MRPLDDKLPARIEDERARLKRCLNFLFGWLMLPVYTALLVWITLTWQSWPVIAVIIGGILLASYALVSLYVYGGISLYRSRGEAAPTEWMRRGGLMASPEASDRPDEARIRLTLGTLPEDFPPAARDAVVAYLAMTDDDEKQLCRDRLIRE